MAIEDVLSRISSLQARFGVSGGAPASEFEGVLSDAARHAGVSPTDRTDDAIEQVSTAGAAPAADSVSTAGDATRRSDEPDAPDADDADDAVAILDDPAGGPSGEALEVLRAAAASTSTAAAALGLPGSSSLLQLLEDQLEGADGTAMLASVIAQQQAGAGIARAADS